MFPPSKPITINATASRQALKIQCIVFGIVSCFFVFAFLGLLVDWHPAIRLLFGIYPGYIVYKLTNSDTERNNYSGITFKNENMIVHFFERPDLEIWYKDIVKVSPENDGASPSVMLTGNYPILMLNLHKLEGRAEHKFIDFLYANGLGA